MSPARLFERMIRDAWLIECHCRFFAFGLPSLPYSFADICKQFFHLTTLSG